MQPSTPSQALGPPRRHSTPAKLVLSTGTTQALTIGGSAGPWRPSVWRRRTPTPLGPSAISGDTLTIGASANSTLTTITFGTGAGQVSTLNQLNTALAANNLQASIDTTGVISITTSNNAASSTIGEHHRYRNRQSLRHRRDRGGSGRRSELAGDTCQPGPAVQSGAATDQHHSQDSSFNGINLLNGDTLNLTFDETGASKLAIAGYTFNDAGLGLSTLTTGTDFLDSNSANAVLAQLTQPAPRCARQHRVSVRTSRSCEIRQDFNKNLINVLQTGASNLTVADPNEEAANSQALSTRQSIAVSALALANQSQQSVLQLLR